MGRHYDINHLFQILTERLPFDGILTSQSDLETEIVSKGIRPPRPGHETQAERRGLSEELWQLICECWSGDPSMRPSAEIVLNRFKNLRLWGGSRSH